MWDERAVVRAGAYTFDRRRAIRAGFLSSTVQSRGNDGGESLWTVGKTGIEWSAELRFHGGGVGPMLLADAELVGALLEDVLDQTIVTEAVDEAMRLLQADSPTATILAIERELDAVNTERARLVTAIAAGGALDGLLQALQARESRRATLETERERTRVIAIGVGSICARSGAWGPRKATGCGRS